MKNLMLAIAIMFTASGSDGQQIKPSNSGYAPANGIKVYYEVYGEGQTFSFTTWCFLYN